MCLSKLLLRSLLGLTYLLVATATQAQRIDFPIFDKSAAWEANASLDFGRVGTDARTVGGPVVLASQTEGNLVRLGIGGYYWPSRDWELNFSLPYFDRADTSVRLVSGPGAGPASLKDKGWGDGTLGFRARVVDELPLNSGFWLGATFSPNMGQRNIGAGSNRLTLRANWVAAPRDDLQVSAGYEPTYSDMDGSNTVHSWRGALSLKTSETLAVKLTGDLFRMAGSTIALPSSGTSLGLALVFKTSFKAEVEPNIGYSWTRPAVMRATTFDHRYSRSVGVTVRMPY